MAYQKPSKGQPRKANDLGRNAAFFGDVVDVVGAHKSGQRPPGGGSAFDRRGPMVFIRNDTNANLKLGEVVELGDYLLDEEDPYKWWYEGNAVSTTFRKRYAIAAEPIPEDQIGAAWVRGPAVLRYAGSAPSSGAGFGPKPATVTLEPGYPCFAIVDDVIDTSEKLAGCTLGEIGTLLCQATADLSAGPVSSNYVIWSGRRSTGADAGFTTLPTIELAADVPDDDFFLAHWANGGWETSAGGEGGGGGGTTLYKCLLSANLSAASGTASIDTVTAFDGSTPPTPTSATNALSLAGLNNDVAIIVEDTSAGSPTYFILNIKHHTC